MEGAPVPIEIVIPLMVFAKTEEELKEPINHLSAGAG